MAAWALNSFRRFLSPPDFGDSELARKAVVLHGICLTALCFPIFLIASSFMAQAVSSRILTATGISFSLAFSAFMVNKCGRYYLSCCILLFGHYCYLLILASFAGGVFSTAFIFLMIIVFWIGFLLSTLIQTIFLFLTIAVGYGYVHLMHADIFSSLTSHSPFSYWTLVIQNFFTLVTTQRLIQSELAYDKQRVEEEVVVRRRAEKIQRDLTLHTESLVAERDQDLEKERLIKAELETLARVKDDFLANLSHELRTPLAAIMGWIEVMNEESCDEDARRSGLLAVQRNASHQLQLIQDLIDMSAVTKGTMTLHLSEVALSAIIQEAIDVLYPSAKVRNNPIIFEAKTANDLIWGDKDRVRQVFWNLLSNSMKFSRENGEIHVRIWADDGNILASVKDEGIGIAPNDLPHVFDRFWYKASDSSAYKGLGLGLAISRHIVDLHGGVIEAASPGVNKGACFTVKFRKAA